MRDSRPFVFAHPAERTTLTNEVELERARQRCLASPDESTSAPANLSRLADEMRGRCARADLSGALATAEIILGQSPDDAEAKACAHACRAKLAEEYTAGIGRLDQVPVLAAPLSELDASSVGHRAGFVLSQVDGETTLEAILDVSGMPSLDALRIVRELLRRGFIRLRS